MRSVTGVPDALPLGVLPQVGQGTLLVRGWPVGGGGYLRLALAWVGLAVYGKSVSGCAGCYQSLRAQCKQFVASTLHRCSSDFWIL